MTHIHQIRRAANLIGTALDIAAEQFEAIEVASFASFVSPEDAALYNATQGKFAAIFTALEEIQKAVK